GGGSEEQGQAARLVGVGAAEGGGVLRSGPRHVVATRLLADRLVAGAGGADKETAERGCQPLSGVHWPERFRSDPARSSEEWRKTSLRGHSCSAPRGRNGGGKTPS